jgi:hypothetical protein
MTGLVALFIKIKDSFSATRQKQEIKLDLEIYELLNNSGDFQNSKLHKSIEENVNKEFETQENGISRFLIGLVVFIGFGLWTIDIFQSSHTFNGLIILTAFLSAIGLSMLFVKTDKTKSKEVFFQIAFYDKSNFLFGLILTLFTAFLTPTLLLKMDGYSFWQFLSGLFFIVGLMSIVKNIKRIK